MRKKKGLPTGFRKNKGSFLRSFLSDALDTGQEAFDEFMERDFEAPAKPESSTKGTAPSGQEKPAASPTVQASRQEVIARVDELAQIIAALAAALSEIKEAQDAEWEELMKNRGGNAR
ncbi:MAG: hypothetical protein ACRERD_30150 [Candidatus Binatia bacterium]